MDQVKWYFYLLEQSYFEVRYPYEIPLPKDGSTMQHDRDMEYLGAGILATSIKLFKLFLSLFDKKNSDFILQYTYTFQKDGYDYMTPKTKEVLEKNEQLYMYLTCKIDTYLVNDHLII